jgi:hypothetical protein
MRIKLMPNKAKPLHNCQEAWWYENKGSIEIYSHLADAPHKIIACKIPRAKLLDYIKRTEKTDE